MAIDVQVEVLIRRPRADVAAFMFDPTNDAIWTTGAEASDPARFKALAQSLGADEARLAAPEVKDALRRNTEEAIAHGVFGVPSYEVDGEIFWGADAIGFVNAFLADPAALRNDEMRRADALPVGAARKA